MFKNINKNNFFTIFSKSISLLFFGASFFFPMYYLNSSQKPVFGAEVHCFGILVFWIGHFAWFANIPYMIAIVTNQKKINSLFFSLVALAMVLYLLVIKQVHIETSVHDMNGFGWGYFFWVNSIIFLIIGQLLQQIYQSKTINISYQISLFGGFFLISLTAFIYYYYYSILAPYDLIKTRNQVMNDICGNIHTKTYQNISNVNGIYIDKFNDIYCNLSKKGDICGYENFNPYLGLKRVENNIFIERKTSSYREENMEYNYIRVLPIYENKRFKRESTNVLKANYGIYTESLNDQIDSDLRLWAEKVKIYNMKTGDLVAESGYVYNTIDKTYCGTLYDNRYSRSLFIRHVLKLK